MATWKKVVTESAAGEISQKVSKVTPTTNGFLRTSSGDGTLVVSTSIAGTSILSNSITASQLAANSVAASELADNAVDTAAIAADAVTGAKIANDAIDSEHIAADSIDSEHYAAGSVDRFAIEGNGIRAGNLDTGCVTTAKIDADAVTNAKIADDAVNLENLSATGTPSSSNYLRGDNTWASVSSYSGWNIGSDDNGSLNAAALGIANGEGAHFLGGDGLSSATSVPSGTGTATVTFDVDTTVVRTTGTQNIAGNKTFSGNTSVANLTVTGTTTTVNTETVNIADNNIVLNSNYTGSSPTDGGISVERGTLANVILNWDESANVWTVKRKNVNAGNGSGVITQNITTSSSGTTLPNVNASFVGQVFVDTGDSDAIYIYS